MVQSESKIQDNIADIIRVLDNFRKFAGINTPNFLSDQVLHGNGLDGDFDRGGQSIRAMSEFRAVLNAARARARAMLTPAFIEYGKFLGFAETDIPAIFRRLRDDFDAGVKSVRERNITFGTITAGGGNAGDGLVNRLNIDDNGDEIEATTPEGRTVECVSDEHGGPGGNRAQEHEEQFEFRGDPAEIDDLKRIGSGVIIPVKALSGNDSNRLINNASFTNFSGTSLAAPTGITDWTVGIDIANFQIVETAADIYRDFEGDGGTPRSILFETNDSLEQNFNIRRTQLDRLIPYYCQIAWQRGTATAGSLQLEMGQSTASVSVVAQTGWQVLRIALGTGNWFDVFNEEDLKIKIGLTGGNGNLHVDDIIFAPMTLADGIWYAIVGGRTPFLIDDIFTWSDTVGTEGIIQLWLWLAFNEYLPHIAAAETWSDPV